MADPMDEEASEAKNVAQDLESFAQHAGRTTVQTDDVLLVTRRNDALHDMIKDFIETEQAKNVAAKEKGKENGARGAKAGRGKARK
ncbi:hypothetical protein HYALB_00000483 [Hymenoscyphus albidus]|uniref:Centromere protein S n=1 Tax=Hymenoscyphus albidus TaxID=595503 RepID=A0A9N9LJI1_9HELO|nr:hypothetical protein HYALB_00000483 [Hymenoscyphus albidus]